MPPSDRRARRFRPRVLVPIVVLSSVLASLVASELILRIAFDPVRVLDGDALWEYRWRKAHAESGTASNSAQRYGFDVYDPDLGWKPRAGYEGRGVRTNALGIRADREFTFAREPGASRIVVVGDSFMWGEDVANEETFASRLSALLAETEVINLGVHGYGTDQQLLRLRALGFRFQPDLVILGFYEEDMWRNALTFRDYPKPRFQWIDDRFELINQPVPAPEAILAEEQRLPRSFVLVLARRALRKASWGLGHGLERSDEWRTTRAILDMARRETEAGGARLLLLYIPASRLDEPGLAERLVVAWAAENQNAFINLRERFAELPAADRRRLADAHWTPFGHCAAAAIVSAFIANHRLLPGSHDRPAEPGGDRTYDAARDRACP